MPPHSVEAEQAVLGGLMLDSNAWDAVADIVTAADFYRRDHRLIFEAIVDVAETRGSCDAVTISEHLERKGRLDEIGGLALPRHDRTRHALGRERARLCRDHPRALDAAAARRRGRRNRGVRDRQPRARRARARGRGRAARVRDRRARQPRPSRVHRRARHPAADDRPPRHAAPDTGRDDAASAPASRNLDRKTTGLQPGDLVVIAGRPSMGKTTLAVNIAENAAIAKGIPVAIFIDGNVARAADPAPHLLARAREPVAPAHGQFQRRGLVAHPGRAVAASARRSSWTSRRR